MKLTESTLRQLIRQVIREAASDKYTHIGYGRYKEKGKEKDKDAQTFKKTDTGKFEPFGDKKGKEKPKPKPKAAKIAADPFADKKQPTASKPKPKQPLKWKSKRQSGRGQSWVNHDTVVDGKNVRLQVSKTGDSYSAWLGEIPSGPDQDKMVDLQNLSKKQAAALQIGIQNSVDLEKTAQAVNSKFKKNLKGKPDIENHEKQADDIISITDDDVRFDGYDANDRPMFKSMEDPDKEYTVDKKGNIWLHTGVTDKVIGQSGAPGKDSETGKDYTSKFTGTDEPFKVDSGHIVKDKGSFFVDREDIETGDTITEPGQVITFSHKGKTYTGTVDDEGQGRDDDTFKVNIKPEKATKQDVDSDMYAQDTWKQGGDDDDGPRQDMFGVTDWEDNADDIIDRLQGEEYDDEYRDKFFQSTVEAGQSEKTINKLLKNPDTIKGEDEALAYNIIKAAIEREELPKEPDSTDLQNFWGTFDEDLYDQIMGEAKEPVVESLKREFSQYDFTKKTKNWKHAL